MEELLLFNNFDALKNFKIRINNIKRIFLYLI